MAAGCASTPTQPPLSPSTGEERVPVDPNGGEIDPDDIEEIFEEDESGEDFGEAKDKVLTPPHMVDREIKRAAVLLPFSHSQARVRSEAEGMLAAIELALFEQAGDNFLIIPKDTSGRADVATAKAEEALLEGADVIIGPLFGGNVQPVTEIAREAGIPVIAFSNDRQAAGGGAFLISITPESEVNSVVEHASNLGVRTYAFLGPDTAYGKRIENALRGAAIINGGAVIVAEKYRANGEGQQEAAAFVAKAIETEPPGTVAVMIPERGTGLRSVAPLLPYNGVDVRRVKLLGTGTWNDPSVWREPTLFGGLFAAPEPEVGEEFKTNYERNYGSAPKGLASLGYDAAALAIGLAADDNLNYQGVMNFDGFIGTNGLFRLRRDGLPDRGLAILEITPDGVEVAQPGKTDFRGGS